MADHVHVTDLDESPHLLEGVLELFRRFGPGRYHAVNGEPSRMGRVPRDQDLQDALGVVVVLHEGQVAGAMALCPYSETQATLWGPIVESGFQGHSFGPLLLSTARQALRDGGFESIRALVDHRNRRARAFFLRSGLSPWKDNLLFERDLDENLPEVGPGIVTATAADHPEVVELILSAFPDTGHCDEPLAERERQGYRHYLLQDGGTVVATAAVKDAGTRSWMSLLAVHPQHRRKGYAKQLVTGVCRAEYEAGRRRMGLEVLADNNPAIRCYEGVGFQRQWGMWILVGPV